MRVVKKIKSISRYLDPVGELPTGYEFAWKKYQFMGRKFTLRDVAILNSIKRVYVNAKREFDDSHPLNSRETFTFTSETPYSKKMVTILHKPEKLVRYDNPSGESTEHFIVLSKSQSRLFGVKHPSIMYVYEL